MIKLFKGVLVVRLWRGQSHQAELCIFPPWVKGIPLHQHKESDIELIHLFGKASYYRQESKERGNSASYYATGKDFLRSFSIPKGTWHSALIKFGLVTLSIQKWNTTTKMTSVTQDYYE